jgi:dienelactone hydrolase
LGDLFPYRKALRCSEAIDSFRIQLCPRCYAHNVRCLLFAALVCVPAFSVVPAAAAQQVSLSVTPAVSLVDAPVSIRVTNARPHARVEISAETAIFGRRFESHATFRANAAGEVNPARSQPLAGTYRSISNMGLFWSMVPAHSAGMSDGAAYDYLAPRQFTFRVTTAGASIVRPVIRTVLAPDVRYEDVKTTGLFARFYGHTNPPRRATVIVLGGAEGGLPEDRPAILASHGFNVLAVAYFGADGLPKSLANIPVETIDSAIAWLAQQSSVDPRRLGIVGGSKGAEFALVAAARSPRIRAVVAFSPSSVVYPGLFYGPTSGPPPSSWSLEGKPLPYVNGTAPDSIEQQISADIKRKIPVSYAPEYLAELRLATNRAAATIEVEHINGPLMLISGDDDRLWPSSFMAGEIMSRLNSRHHSFRDMWLRYAKAGHEIGEPYFFFADSTVAHLPRYDIALGGMPESNQAASEDAWPRMIRFLKANL